MKDSHNDPIAEEIQRAAQENFVSEWEILHRAVNWLEAELKKPLKEQDRFAIQHLCNSINLYDFDISEGANQVFSQMTEEIYNFIKKQSTMHEKYLIKHNVRFFNKKGPHEGKKNISGASRNLHITLALSIFMQFII